MNLDITTLFLVTMHVEIILGLLLFFAWAQDFKKTALAWWGCAHLLRAVSIMIFGMQEALPPFVSVDLANAALFGSFAVTWSGARVFGHRSPEPIWGMVGVVIWIVACRLPQFHQAVELRAMVGSGIVAAYTWLTAYELWRGRAEPLISRWPAIFMLFAHGSLFLLRTPLGVLLDLNPGSTFAASGWFELLSVEALLFTISIAFILLAMAKERTEVRHRTAAQTDALTGIANRRGFLDRAGALPRSRSRSETPVAVMLVDIDHFKAINDTLGHAVGDGVLQTFARTAASVLRPDDLFARWGGDEFAILIQDATAERAMETAEAIRTAFAAASQETMPDGASASIGAAFSVGGIGDLTALLAEADRALYRAKENGRNRVELSAPGATPPRPAVRDKPTLDLVVSNQTAA